MAGNNICWKVPEKGSFISSHQSHKNDEQGSKYVRSIIDTLD